MMAVFKDKRRVGSLSSGCVEAGIALHAVEALAKGRPKIVHYGRGSWYRDIQLSCGGEMSVRLIPAPDLTVLREVCECHAARKILTLRLHTETGALSLVGDAEAEAEDAIFLLQMTVLQGSDLRRIDPIPQ
jgi:xanthine dehydrogenase accessory factor